MALTRIGSVGLATGIDINAGVGTFTGNLTVGGVLTYEDVTNVDSIGIVTARAGVLVGSGITLSKDGDIFATGVTTATTFVGALTGNVTGNISGGTVAGSTGTFTGDVDIADKIIHTGDTDTAIRFPAADTITAETGGSERLRIDDGGTLLIGLTTRRLFATGHTSQFQLEGLNSLTSSSLSIVNNQASTGSPNIRLGKTRGTSIGSNTSVADGDQLGQIIFYGADGTDIYNATGLIGAVVNGTVGTDTIPTDLVFQTSATTGSGRAERLRITSDGRVLINSTASRNIGANISRMLQVESSGGGAGIAVVRNSANTSGPTLDLGKSRGYPNTIVQSGDKLGVINFSGADGTNLQTSAAQISGEVDGTPGSSDMPGRIVFKTTADGAASPTERMRITKDGDVCIGVDTPARGPLHVHENSSSDCQIHLTNDNTGSTSGDGLTIFTDTDTSGIWSREDVPFQIATNGSERLRITSTGRLLVATTTSSPNGADGYIQSVVAGTSLGAWGSNAGSTGNRKHMRFSNPNGVIGSIHTSGSGTGFNTSSDYRLKENQTAISDAISKINQLKPYTFNFKANPSEKIDGFFAHEAQELIPYAVDGEKDGEEMQSMDYGKLTPLLTAALQEAVAKIEVLESKVASLGG